MIFVFAAESDEVKQSERSIELTGESLLALRDSWGLTQASLARVANSSREWVARMERPGIKPVDKTKIAHLAEACGLWPAEFVQELRAWDSAPAQSKPQLPRLRMTLNDLMLETPIGDDPGDMVFGDVHEGERFPSRAIALPVFERDVAAGPFSLVVDHTQADERVFVPKKDLDGLSPDKLFVLSLRGHSMRPTYISGDRVVIERIQIEPEALARLKSGLDFVVCVRDTGECCFKQLVENSRDKLVFDARNPKFKSPLVVPKSAIGMIGLALGKVDYTVYIDQPRKRGTHGRMRGL